MRTIRFGRKPLLSLALSTILFAIVGVFIASAGSSGKVAAATGPTTPTGLAGTATTTSVSLTWKASTDKAGIKNYTIYRNGTKLTTTTALKYTDSGLLPLTSYSYAVQATDKNSINSAKSTAVAVTTLAAPPTGLVATSITTTQVSLSWAAPANSSKLTGFYIYRAGVKIGTVTKTTLSYTDKTVIAGTSYAYTIKGYYGSAKLTPASNTLTVKTPAKGTIQVAACSDISAPGSYILNNSLTTAASTPCINIHDTNNVTFDCNNFEVLGNSLAVLTIQNVTTFNLVNCTIALQIPAPNAPRVGTQITGTTGGTVQNNTFAGRSRLEADNNSQLTVKNNTFSYAEYQQKYGMHNTVSNNSFGFPNYSGGEYITLEYGNNNTIDTNTMNGYGGGIIGQSAYGYDDGMLVQYEDADLVNNNTVSNFYDCGIETLGLITNSTFSNNTINSAQNCGIGGWYYSSWQNNTVSGNKVDNANYLFDFFNLYGIPAGSTYDYFQNNKFTGNTFTNGHSSNQYESWFDISDSTSIPASQIIATGNVFTNNNFGSQYWAPLFRPAGMLVDGGGNICGIASPQSYDNLACKQP